MASPGADPRRGVGDVERGLDLRLLGHDVRQPGGRGDHAVPVLDGGVHVAQQVERIGIARRPLDPADQQIARPLGVAVLGEERGQAQRRGALGGPDRRPRRRDRARDRARR
jgi:hypothetical protein